MTDIKTELKEIQDFNNLSKDEQRLTMFLRMNHYNDKLINIITQHLKSRGDYKKDSFSCYN